MGLLTTLYILTWDTYLATVNLLTPKLKKGSRTAGVKWPEFHPPVDGDSRGSCPALNALCNHGLLPRDGKDITFVELSKVVHEVYNFAESFCLFVPNYSADMLGRKYATDKFDLAELDIRNGQGGKGIEHDGSLVRKDLYWEKDQSVICEEYVRELLGSASGIVKGQDEKVLTNKDVSRYLSIRRAHFRNHNPDFKPLSGFHRFFGSSNAATMVTIFGGNVADLETVLLEERLPEGWESYIRARKGLTMASFNVTAGSIEFGINEAKGEQELKASGAVTQDAVVA